MTAVTSTGPVRPLDAINTVGNEDVAQIIPHRQRSNRRTRNGKRESREGWRGSSITVSADDARDPEIEISSAVPVESPGESI